MSKLLSPVLSSVSVKMPTFKRVVLSLKGFPMIQEWVHLIYYTLSVIYMGGAAETRHMKDTRIVSPQNKKCQRLSERYCHGQDNCITCYPDEVPRRR